MLEINELNSTKVMKTGNTKLYKNFLKFLMSAGLLSTALTGCAPEEQITDPIVVKPTDPVEERSQIEILAENYDHLAWYLDDSTTKTVDGVAYDLASLKQQYGDLYRFVEPLSKEEVEDRFQYLAEFFQIQVQDGGFEDYKGGISDVSQTTFGEFVDKRILFHEKMGTTNDELLLKYKLHYPYSVKVEKYVVTNGGTFNDVEDLTEIINFIDQISFEDKDWFVRNYMTEVDILFEIIEKNDEEPRFNFELEQRTR